MVRRDFTHINLIITTTPPVPQFLVTGKILRYRISKSESSIEANQPEASHNVSNPSSYTLLSMVSPHEIIQDSRAERRTRFAVNK
jgi:hypothetical protein